MSPHTDRPRWSTFAAAALLLVAGLVLGVMADRFLLLPREAEADPLTAEAMLSRLDLEAGQETEVRALLDSLHGEMMAVVQRNPDSLHAAAQEAHRRIESALPPDARHEFRAWVHEHRSRLLGHMPGHPLH
ncbi:MAG: hypothetical protein WD960_02845 [Gemmatimonadota bacterium]